MSQIVKAFLGVFLTIFMAVVALGVLNTYMEVMSAQDMQARIVDELENSNFDTYNSLTPNWYYKVLR